MNVENNFTNGGKKKNWRLLFDLQEKCFYHGICNTEQTKKKLFQSVYKYLHQCTTTYKMISVQELIR